MPALKLLISTLVLLLSVAAVAEQERTIPQTNSSYIDSEGTAHITRVVPVPKTVSPEAQKWLARSISDIKGKATNEEERTRAAASQKQVAIDMQAVYPTQLREDNIAGVPVRVITPPSIPVDKRDRVIINVHGGGFVADWGSVGETIPIASLTQTKVIAVLYRLAPEHPFPAAVEDVVAVYKELLKTHKPKNMVLYGGSAGAILTAEVAVKLKLLGLPLPAALGIFSGMGDWSRYGDSEALFSLQGLSGPLDLVEKEIPPDPYAGSTDRRDPVLSPVFADLRGMPPTLFVTSTRDTLLSGTVTLHRAFLQAGNNAELVVFEGLTHGFWMHRIPEALEAHHLMANFFEKQLEH